MWVIKIGGSLTESHLLPQWLNRIAEQGRGQVVIVPGGGKFADQVRHIQKILKFNEHTAHRMALLAMQQFGLILAASHVDFEAAYYLNQIPSILTQNRIAIWMPDYTDLDAAGVEETWNVSSDSLSAWLAGSLSATHLVVLKHLSNGINGQDISSLVRQGVLDKAFYKYTKNSTFCVHIQNVEQLTDFKFTALRSEDSIIYES